MAVCVPVSLLFELSVDGRVSFPGLVIGLVLATPLALLEESAFDERVRRLPLSVAILTKVLKFVGSVLGVFLLVGFVFGWLRGLTVEDFLVSVREPVLDNVGEIYEYVGDEAVLTWKAEKGLKGARCLRVFSMLFAIG